MKIIIFLLIGKAAGQTADCPRIYSVFINFIIALIFFIVKFPADIDADFLPPAP